MLATPGFDPRRVSDSYPFSEVVIYQAIDTLHSQFLPVKQVTQMRYRSCYLMWLIYGRQPRNPELTEATLWVWKMPPLKASLGEMRRKN